MVENLEPRAIIGFDGSVYKGLKIHPDGEYIVYPMGNKVCIQNWKTKSMVFLSGHSNSVSTVALSQKGTYIGSGQINHIGFKASVKVWDFQKHTCVGSHELHKVRVEALAFTSDERYLVSLGGRDDGFVVLWDTTSASATATLSAVRLTTGDANTLTSLSQRSNAFVTGGDGNLRVWNVQAATKTLDVVDVALGKLRRTVRCISVAEDDSYGIAGTTTGDMIKFTIKYPSDPKAPVTDIHPSLIGCFAKCGNWIKGKVPETMCYSQGIESVLIMDDGCLVVGGGDGTIDVLDEINWRGEFPKEKVTNPVKPYYKALKTTKLIGSITSLELMESPHMNRNSRLLLAGTRTSEIYAINVTNFAVTLVVTCHRCAINAIAFPRGLGGVFATGGAGDVRVWCAVTCRELLRVCVPNFVCAALLISTDGRSIVTGWSDGNIRAFTPLTGRLIYCIYNTHNKGTSALDMTSDNRTLISGGCEGQVRIWDILPQKQSLKKVLKEHKSPVSAIQVSPNDMDAVSAGTDGSCIIWDLTSLCRRQVMYANTLFMAVCYNPTGCQLLTGGSDRRVAYWETGSGNLARELEASKVGAVNALDVSSDGQLFVSGGNDQMIKLWKYAEGIYTHVGLGHAGAVTCCRFSPDCRLVVSADVAGGLVVWRVPEQYIPQKSAPATVRSPTEVPQLPLDKKASGDRVFKVPAAPNKEERIESMDTSRSSIHACCPCPTTGDKKSPLPKGASPKSQTSKGPSPKGQTPKQSPKPSPNSKDCCTSKSNKTDNLPTRTTSKDYVNGSGSGDRKR